MDGRQGPAGRRSAAEGLIAQIRLPLWSICFCYVLRVSENVQTAMFEILKSIQSKLAEHDKRFDAVEKRFDEIGEFARKQRRDTAGLPVMARAVAGVCAERVAAIQERFAALEARGR